MIHFASPAFWVAYESLPASIQQLADRNFNILKTNPEHPSLHFKKRDVTDPFGLASTIVR